MKRKEQTTPKDEDVLFGELLVTQIKQLKPVVKLVVKMEIHNQLYKHLLAHNSTETQPSYYMLNTVGPNATNKYPPPTATTSANTEVSHGLIRLWCT